MQGFASRGGSGYLSRQCLYLGVCRGPVHRAWAHRRNTPLVLSSVCPAPWSQSPKHNPQTCYYHRISSELSFPVLPWAFCQVSFPCTQLPWQGSARPTALFCLGLWVFSSSGSSFTVRWAQWALPAQHVPCLQAMFCPRMLSSCQQVSSLLGTVMRRHAFSLCSACPGC